MVCQDGDDDLSRDIRLEVRGEYYLTEIIKKGVAYHIGYLPAAIQVSPAIGLAVNVMDTKQYGWVDF